MTGIWQYLHKDLITFYEPKDRNEALTPLIQRATELNFIANAEEFTEAIERRESMVSTGVGLGVALPHTKSDGCPDFFISVGITQKGVEWGALDDKPVHFIFLIGGPDDRPKNYLRLLSELSNLLKDEERRKDLLQASTPHDVLVLFE